MKNNGLQISDEQDFYHSCLCGAQKSWLMYFLRSANPRPLYMGCNSQLFYSFVTSPNLGQLVNVQL